MNAEPAHYICIDVDGPVIRVYDGGSEPDDIKPRTFTTFAHAERGDTVLDDERSAYHAAMAYAQRLASRLKCGFGTNE